MTDLEKRAKTYANNWLKEVHKLELKHKTDPKPEYIRIQQAYKDGATQETALLSQHILELQKDKGNLTDKVADLEDKLANADYQLEGRDLEIKELKEQIEKMKNCKNCANYMISGKCPCFFRTGWCKNWEMTKGGKND